MREILFRGILKYDNSRYKRGQWVFGDLARLQDGNDGKPHIYGYGEVLSKTVGQYTGLTDKNGKQIFEGDIVKISFVDGIEIGAIGWSNLDFRFKFASPDGNAYGIDCLCDIEVIGNIYDNPELLKGGAE